jgi:hypothetical protein
MIAAATPSADLTMPAGTLSVDVTAPAAALPIAIGAAVIAIGVLTSLRYGLHGAPLLTLRLSLGVEFFLAAGVIRLTSANTFEMLGLAAAIILARRVIRLGLRYGAQATG